MLIFQMTTVQQLLKRSASFRRPANATIKGWQYAIRGFETKDAESIDEDFVIDRRIELLDKGYASGYVRTQLGYCQSIWKWGIKTRTVTTNPWVGSLEGLEKGGKDYPFLPFSHYEECGLTEHPLFMGLWYHGMRVEELCGLQPEDIFLNHEYPHFKIYPNGIRGIKNKPSRREVPIHRDYERFIENFPFNTNPKAGDNFSRYMKRRCGHSAHGIRHHAATRMRKARIEYSISASILGHSPAGMTANYGHILLEDKYAQLQLLE